MAEWLGRGLQNLVQRFESASDLQNPFYTAVWRGFTFLRLNLRLKNRPLQASKVVKEKTMSALIPESAAILPLLFMLDIYHQHVAMCADAERRTPER